MYATPLIPRFTSANGKNFVTTGAVGGKTIEFQDSAEAVETLAMFTATLTGACAQTPPANIPLRARPAPVDRIFIPEITSYRLLESVFGQHKLSILTLALQTRPTIGVKF